MHYYKRNIGDYHKKAGRLTMLQHGAYTLLMDSCYDREEFPTLDMAIDWLWASTDAEVDAVKFVLNKFFILESDVYTQNRIKEDLDKYHANSKTNKRIAIEREAKRKESSTKRVPSVNESNTVKHEATPNHKPLTTNHKPLTTNQEPLKDLSATPPVKCKQIESDFDVYWMAGMAKQGRKAALAKFKKLANQNGGSFVFANMLSTDVKKRLASGQMGFDVLHPATYLNNERWKDEIKQVQQTRFSDGNGVMTNQRGTMPDRSEEFRKLGLNTTSPVNDDFIEGSCDGV